MNLPQLASGKAVYDRRQNQARECQVLADHYRAQAAHSCNEALRQGYTAQAESWQRVADSERRKTEGAV